MLALIHIYYRWRIDWIRSGERVITAGIRCGGSIKAFQTRALWIVSWRRFGVVWWIYLSADWSNMWISSLNTDSLGSIHFTLIWGDYKDGCAHMIYRLPNTEISTYISLIGNTHNEIVSFRKKDATFPGKYEYEHHTRTLLLHVKMFYCNIMLKTNYETIILVFRYSTTYNVADSTCWMFILLYALSGAKNNRILKCTKRSHQTQTSFDQRRAKCQQSFTIHRTLHTFVDSWKHTHNLHGITHTWREFRDDTLPITALNASSQSSILNVRIDSPNIASGPKNWTYHIQRLILDMNHTTSRSQTSTTLRSQRHLLMTRWTHQQFTWFVA